MFNVEKASKYCFFWFCAVPNSGVDSMPMNITWNVCVCVCVCVGVTKSRMWGHSGGFLGLAAEAVVL